MGVISEFIDPGAMNMLGILLELMTLTEESPNSLKVQLLNHLQQEHT